MTEAKPSHRNNDVEFAMALGEIRGQLRELIHSVNDGKQQDATVNGALAELKSIPGDIREIKASVSDIDSKLKTLELKEAAQASNRGLVKEAIRSPILAWLFALATLLWALLTGKVNLSG